MSDSPCLKIWIVLSETDKWYTCFNWRSLWKKTSTLTQGSFFTCTSLYQVLNCNKERSMSPSAPRSTKIESASKRCLISLQTSSWYSELPASPIRPRFRRDRQKWTTAFWGFLSRLLHSNMWLPKQHIKDPAHYLTPARSFWSAPSVAKLKYNHSESDTSWSILFWLYGFHSTRSDR